LTRRAFISRDVEECAVGKTRNHENDARKRQRVRADLKEDGLGQSLLYSFDITLCS
jgi:hypothetical protein